MRRTILLTLVVLLLAVCSMPVRASKMRVEPDAQPGRTAALRAEAAPRSPSNRGQDARDTTPHGATISRPNLVIINIDDLGYGDIGPFGSTLNRTPNLDRMAAEGRRLTTFYAAPVCSPSRAALMTGCYPKRALPIPHVLFPGNDIGLAPAEVTVAEVLKSAGYVTGIVGKWHLGDQPEFLPTRQGFDEWFGLPYSNDMGPAADGVKSSWGAPLPAEAKNPQPPLPLLRGETVVQRVRAVDQTQLVTRYTEEALRFIRAHKDERFFLYLAHNAVHFPLYPGDRFRGKSANGLYGDWVEEMDWSVGEVLDALRTQGLADKTLVLFVSDNGGTPRAVNRQLRGYKGSTWEGGVRVPAIVWWPGEISAGTSSDAICGMFDILPTFAALAGAAVPSDRKIDGADIRSVLFDDVDEPGPHEVFYYYRGLELEAVRDGQWKLVLPAATTRAAGKAKAQAAKERKAALLFDLKTDIGESTDVAAQHPEIVARLEKLVAAMKDDLGAGGLGPGCRPLGKVADARPLIGHDGKVRPGFEPKSESAAARPNILFIAVDDLNGCLGHMGGHPLAKTPHLDKLAERGTTFLNAHCQSPLCNPSRTSLMLSLRPTTTGIYGLAPWFRTLPEWRDRVALPQYFKAAGYRTYTTGKVYHGNAGGPAARGREFDVWGPGGGIGVKPPHKLIPPTPMGNHPLMDWGTFPHGDEDKGDYQITSWAIERLQRAPRDEPMFLAVGYVLPHVPCYATQPWFDLYPDNDSVLSSIRRDDRDDTPRFSWYLHWQLPEPRLKWVEENHQWRNLVRSYLACTSFIDAQIGRLLEALQASGRAENTIVVVWGDNGYHLGEKLITGKNTLWDEGTRVPLIFAGPGIKGGQRCRQPAELLDIYPTLVELCGLPPRPDLEGLSLVPQLTDAHAPRERPAITSHNQGNHGIRSERYRYIRYADGSEEFYDMQRDPHAWTNLAGDQRYADLIAAHRKWLPRPDVPPAPGSASRILVYDAATDEAVWEGRTTIRRSDPIP